MKILFHLVMPSSIQSAIMAVAHVPYQAIFNYVSLVRIGARLMDGCQECTRWCQRYGLLATQMNCPARNRHCREQALDRVVDGVYLALPCKGL